MVIWALLSMKSRHKCDKLWVFFCVRLKTWFFEPPTSRALALPSPYFAISWVWTWTFIICSVKRLFRVDDPRGASQIWRRLTSTFNYTRLTLHLYKFRGFLKVQTGQSQLSSKKSSCAVRLLFFNPELVDGVSTFGGRPMISTISDLNAKYKTSVDISFLVLNRLWNSNFWYHIK